jgi:glutathione S-transferase
MLRIWGRNNSVNVQKVLWCCEEMELPYERVDAGGSFGVVNTQQYRNLNPNGLVPTIEEDGFVLWESNAIVRYLVAKHSAGKLWPENLNVRAEADKEDSRLKTAELLGYLDAHVKNRAYLAGDTLSMGDIPLGCAIWRWMGLPVERPELPHVQRWFDSLGARIAYKKVVMLPLT